MQKEPAQNRIEGIMWKRAILLKWSTLKRKYRVEMHSDIKKMWAKEKAQSENTFEHKREIQNEIIAEEITLCAHVEDSSTFFSLFLSPIFRVCSLNIHMYVQYFERFDH